MIVPITALYGATNAVLNVALAANVTRLRAKTNVFLGTGDSAELLVAARRHGNNAEYVALLLVLMLVAELGGGSATVLHGIGVTFTVSRLSHAIGVGNTPSGPRALGALLTWIAILTAGVYALVLSMR